MSDISSKLVREILDGFKDNMVQLKSPFRDCFFAWIPTRAKTLHRGYRWFWLTDLFVDSEGNIYDYICEFPELNGDTVIKIKRPHEFNSDEN